MNNILKLKKNRFAIILQNKIVLIDEAHEHDIENILEYELKQYKEQYNTNENADKTSYITIMPTYDCNLKCIYCYARGGDEQKEFSLELAQASIRAIRKFSDASKLRIDFIGGEPFLNFSIMDYSYQFAKSKYDDVTVHIVSNGTFSSEHLKWVIDNKFSIVISHDGICHEKQRPSRNKKKTSSLIEGNIQKLLNSNSKTIIQTIVTSYNLNYLKESIEFFLTFGLKIIKIEPVHIFESCRGSSKLIPTPQEFVHYFIDLLKFIKEKKLNVSIYSSLLFQPNDDYYCGINGQNIIVTPSGHISACTEITRINEPFSESIIYGHVDLEQNKILINHNIKSKLKKLHHNYLNCLKCPLQLMCKGGCPLNVIRESGFPPTKSKYVCAVKKLLIPSIFNLIIDDIRYADIIFQDHNIEILNH